MRLTTLPSSREAPPSLIRDLRGLDDTIDLYYVGEGLWWLGSVRPNFYRKQAALTILATEAISGKNRWHVKQQALLLLEGFAIISQHEIQGEPDHRIYQDLEYRNWLWNNHREPQLHAKFMEAVDDDAKEEARAAVMREKIRMDGRYLFKRMVRQNPTVGWRQPSTN